MLLDVTLDLVLNEIGGDRVQHRAHHEVLYPLSPSCIDDREADRAFGRRQGRADVVNLLDALDRARKHVRISQVADDDLIHTCSAKRSCGCLGLNARANGQAACHQFGNEQMALIAVRGSYQNHEITPLSVRVVSYERRSSTLMDEGSASTPASARPRFSIQVSRLFAACRLPARQFRAINCKGMRLLIADAPEAQNSVSIAVAHAFHT